MCMSCCSRRMRSPAELSGTWGRMALCGCLQQVSITVREDALHTCSRTVGPARAEHAARHTREIAVGEHAPVVGRRVPLQRESNVRRRRLALQVEHLFQARQRHLHAGLYASEACHVRCLVFISRCPAVLLQDFRPPRKSYRGDSDFSRFKLACTFQRVVNNPPTLPSVTFLRGKMV